MFSYVNGLNCIPFKIITYPMFNSTFINTCVYMYKIHWNCLWDLVDVILYAIKISLLFLDFILKLSCSYQSCNIVIITFEMCLHHSKTIWWYNLFTLCSILVILFNIFSNNGCIRFLRSILLVSTILILSVSVFIKHTIDLVFI